MQKSKAIIAYIPTPHRGYMEFFAKHEGADIFVLNQDFIDDFPALTRNLPALSPSVVVTMLRATGNFRLVRCINKMDAYMHLEGYSDVIMPDEDVSRAIAQKYFKDLPVRFESIWLRWHKNAALQGKIPDAETTTISFDSFDREMMGRAYGEATRSPDWWRQIGALLVKDRKVLFVSYNKHNPSDQSAYCYGDPRSNFDAGQEIDRSLALHAEMGVLIEAARKGQSTEGCDLYVTTFPCGPCAYSCAHAGIKRLFYSEGYSQVAGADTLIAKGVKLIRVDMQPSL